MSVEHKNIADGDLHEPKGIISATLNDSYLADGAGSGTWEALNPHGGIFYSNIGTGTTYTTPTAYVVMDTVTTSTHLHNFTNNSLNRLTYTGTPARHIMMATDIVLKHSVGSGQDVFFAIFKNGVEETGSNTVQTADSANYQHVTIAWDDEVVTSDYYEIYLKCASGNVIVHKSYMLILGVPD